VDANDSNDANKKLKKKMVKNNRKVSVHSFCDNMDSYRNTIFVMCYSISDRSIVPRVIVPNVLQLTEGGNFTTKLNTKQ